MGGGRWEECRMEVGLISIGLLRTIVVGGRACGKRVGGRMNVGWD